MFDPRIGASRVSLNLVVTAVRISDSDLVTQTLAAESLSNPKFLVVDMTATSICNLIAFTDKEPKDFMVRRVVSRLTDLSDVPSLTVCRPGFGLDICCCGARSC